jgi:fatty acid desaturase
LLEAALRSAVLIPFGAALFVPGVFSWPLAAAYLGLFLYLLAPFVTMFHDVNHHKLFAKRYAWGNQLILWVLGPVYGSTPETYFIHHIGMHHPEENLEADISSTLPYQRDSLRDFARYYLRFFFCFFEMGAYLKARGRKKLLRRLWLGELSYFAAMAAASWLDWRAALTVFLIPLIVGRSVLIIGNWGEHAFVDPLDPASVHRSSTNLVGEKVNRRCFNVGYHIGHHLKPGLHFSELDREWETQLRAYGEQDVLAFRDLHYPDLWFMLMAKRYDWLAGRFVRLPGAPERSSEELVALFKSRLVPIRVAGVATAKAG